MNTVIQKLKEPWGLMRLIRLLFGLYVAVDGYMTQKWMFIGLGFVVFMLPAILNEGCNPFSKTASCSPATTTAKQTDSDEVEFEEIK